MTQFLADMCGLFAMALFLIGTTALEVVGRRLYKTRHCGVPGVRTSANYPAQLFTAILSRERRIFPTTTFLLDS